MISAQENPALPENSVSRISDHVYAIFGFPNIGIVVGERGTLVVDNGLGPRNGEIVARQAAKLAKGPALYLTTTHYHPEHVAGEQAFPPSAVLIRNATQQGELDRNGMQMIEQFAKNPRWTPYLQNIRLRAPDIVYDHDLKLDLGGVIVRLLWLGGGHTVGDQLIYVETDEVLISGDLVQNKITPSAGTPGGSFKSWIAVLDKIAQLKIKTVLPTHTAPGPGPEMIAEDRALFSELQSRALALKRMGISADDAAKQMLAELKTKHPDYEIGFGFAGTVKKIYDEN